jgi:hypothetical protein
LREDVGDESADLVDQERVGAEVHEWANRIVICDDRS